MVGWWRQRSMELDEQFNRRTIQWKRTFDAANIN
jgi:hypothetical protein